jgi:outer membrane receptor for ferrienterochelin and colicin
MRFFYTFVLLFGLGFAFHFLNAQSKGAIRGNLTNRKTGQIINTGKLTLIPTGRKKAQKLETQPTENGTFIFREVPEGVYDLEYKQTGVYKTQRLVGLYVKDAGQKLAYFRLNDALIGEDTTAVELIQTYASLQAAKEKEVKTASLSADKLVDAPATVYLVTQEDIAEQGLQYLNDVLELIPGIEIQEKAHYYSNNIHTVRGVQGTKKFILLLDGVRISSFVASLSLYNKNIFIGNAAQIEIVLGAASALYGADALTGVINIISQRPENTSLSVSQQVGRFGTQSYDVHATLKTKNVSFLLNAAHYRSQDAPLPKFYPQDPSYDWYLNHYSKTGAMPLQGAEDSVILPIYPYQTPISAYWINFLAAGKKWEIGGQFNSEKMSGSFGYPSEYASFSPKDFFTLNGANIFGKYYFSNKSNTLSIQSLLNFNYNELSPKSSSTNAFGTFEKVYYYGFDRTFQTNHNLEYQLSKNQKLQAGLGFNYTDALPTHFNIFPQPFTRGNLSQQFANQYYVGSNDTLDNGQAVSLAKTNLKIANQYNIGVFVQHKIALQNKLFITSGLRLDYIRQEASILRPTAKIGIVYTPTNSLNIRANFGTAFLAPALDYVYVDYVAAVPVTDTNTNTVSSYSIPYAFIGNNKLKEEQMYNGELGVSYSKNNLFLSAVGFASQINNFISSKSFSQPEIDEFNAKGGISGYPVEYIDQYTNQGKLLSYGGSAQAEYREKFGKNQSLEIRLNANYAYTNGYLSTPSKEILALPYTAQHTLKAGFTISYKKLSANVRAIYRSSTPNGGLLNESTGRIDQLNNKAYYLLNTYISYRIEQPKYSNWYADIFVRVRNLTDNRYYQPTINYLDAMGLSPQDPLRWSVGLKFFMIK